MFVPSRWVVVVVLAWLAACGDNLPAHRTVTVGPGGGTVTLGGASLEIPSGALPSDVEITIEQLDERPDAAYEAFSPIYQFSPEGLVFDSPVTVTFRFAGDPNLAGVFWTLLGSEELELLGGDVAGSAISASVTHFSKGFVGNKTKQPCRDGDGDSYGRGCANGPDCKDNDPSIHPGATEACNKDDDDCDGTSDEGFAVGTTCGVGACAGGAMECAPDGTARCDTMPGGSVDASSVETFNAIDDDCDGAVDDGFVVPEAPTTIVAAAGNAQATVSWTAPVDGGSPITSYRVTSAPDGITASVVGGATQATVTGLTNGTSYTFTVVATNALGDGPASAPSNAVTPATVPDAPTNVTATAGNAQATVQWTAPSSDGGLAISGYTVTSSPDGVTASVAGGTLQATVTGLSNGTSYTFTVAASNADGSGPASAASNAVTPERVVISGPFLLPNGVVVEIRWQSVTENDLLYYLIQRRDPGTSAFLDVGTYDPQGTGVEYAFADVPGAGGMFEYRLQAVLTDSTSLLVGGQSLSLLGPPGSPTNVMATAGNAQSTVMWTPPVNPGSSAITSYTVTSSPGDITATAAAGATEVVVTGLTNGTTYRFTVTATNADGTGSASLPSNAVTPATMPSAPTGVSAVAGNASATVSWTAPDNGGLAIQSYSVTSSPGGITATTTGATSVVVPGLTNGTAYTFTVTATNAVGTGPASAPSNAVTPEPVVITGFSAIASSGTIEVRWQSVTENEIEVYIVRRRDPGMSEFLDVGAVFTSGNGSSYLAFDVPGMGGTFEYRLEALLIDGTTKVVSGSQTVDLLGPPGRPTNVMATAGNAQSTVMWTPPVNPGSSAITGYTVTSSPGGITATASASAAEVVVAGLTNGTTYTFTVTATNADGTGSASLPSNAVTPATTPGAPTGVSAVAGNAQATVSWTAPDNGGLAIQSYTVTSSPGGFTATTAGTTQATVTGLTNGTSYTFAVTASNAVGTGAASAASNAVTPAALPSNLARDDFWLTNGTVRTMARGNGVVYLGGDFTYVGPPTGSFGAFDAVSGAPAPNLVKLTSAGTAVTAIAPDGAGGWYLGGNITIADTGVQRSLVHITASGQLDASFAPQLDGFVGRLEVSGGVMYVSGSFTSVGGQPRNRLAAFDLGTGTLTAWNPDVNGDIFGMTVSSNTVYIVGQFTSVGGQSRLRVAAIDATTGLPTAWNPGSNGITSSVAVGNGVVYVGGYFSSVGGQARYRIAALDATTGVATAWNPGPATGASTVTALAVNGNTVYVAGQFSSMGGQPRIHLAAVDATTGLATSWNPNPNLAVQTLLVSGGVVYASGDFTTIGGQPRNHLAALDLTTGNATAWSAGTNGRANAIAVLGGMVYVGGDFQSYGGVLRDRLAALDAITGVATAWDPGANGSVTSLAVDGNTVYVGGAFGSVGGQTRNRLAAVDALTGAATAWNPDLNDKVNAVQLSGGALYVGGRFTSAGGQPRSSLAAFDTVTGSLTAWAPTSDGEVLALVTNGTTVYVGGWFSAISGLTRTGLAAIDTTTGLATSWDPNPSGAIQAIALAGNVVYIGRERALSFSSNAVQAFDATTGAVLAWNPQVKAFVGDTQILALVVMDGNVYVGGIFQSVGALSRSGIAAIDVTTALATAWNPYSSAGRSFLVDGARLYVGANIFHRTDGLYGGQLGVFDPL